MSKEKKPVVVDKRKEVKPFKTTISAQDLGELNARTSKVNEKFFEYNVFKENLQLWQSSMMSKYGVKEGMTCNINLKTGEVEESK